MQNLTIEQHFELQSIDCRLKDASKEEIIVLFKELMKLYFGTYNMAKSGLKKELGIPD